MKIELGKTYITGNGKLARVIGADKGSFVVMYDETVLLWANELGEVGDSGRDLVYEVVPAQTYYRAVVYHFPDDTSYYSGGVYLPSKEEIREYLGDYVIVDEWEEKQLPYIGDDE